MLGAASVLWPWDCSGSRCDSCEGGTEDAEEEEDEEEEAGLDLECRSFSLRRFSGVTVSGFTGVGCSVAGATGKKLSRVSLVCFGVVGASPVDCTKRGAAVRKRLHVTDSVLPAPVSAASCTFYTQQTLFLK